jgi:hypothetical protein
MQQLTGGYPAALLLPAPQGLQAQRIDWKLLGSNQKVLEVNLQRSYFTRLGIEKNNFTLTQQKLIAYAVLGKGNVIL